MTPRFAVIGDPVAHSASPRMHGAAYAALGLDCAYEAVRTTEDELPEVLRRLRAGELAGLNVTVPHKRRVLLYVDVVDGSAARRRRGEHAGTHAGRAHRRAQHGRPGHGARAARAHPHLPELRLEGRARARARHGSDGARSAVVVLGRDLGVAEITVRGRALEDGSAARDALGGELGLLLGPAAPDVRLRLQPWVLPLPRSARSTPSSRRRAWACRVATPASPPRARWPGTRCLAGRSRSTSSTLTGPPPSSPRRARTGLRVTDGRGMLARQGALAFELWLARSAPLDVMRASLAA